MEYTDKKEKKIFLIYKEIQIYEEGLPNTVYEEMRNEERASHILLYLQPIPPEFPYIWGKLYFLFLSVIPT